MIGPHPLIIGPFLAATDQAGSNQGPYDSYSENGTPVAIEKASAAAKAVGTARGGGSSPGKGETMKHYLAVLMITLFTTVTAFADVAASRDKTVKGAVIGGVAGGVIGAVISNNRAGHSAKRGAIVGAVAGTAAGAIVGAMMDKQERELRQVPGVEVQRTANDELNVVVKNDVLFDFNSSALRSSSRSAMQEMASVFEKYPNTTISVQGHADSVGTVSYNERLSQRRANSVAGYIESLGVRSNRVETLGYGESQPRATNTTASGRQLNRRVEIHVKANQA
jgi:outer membrane protein OmpA-like peptidoglycan-associated protein